MTTNSGIRVRRLGVVTVGQPAKEVDDVLSPIGVQVHLNSMGGRRAGARPIRRRRQPLYGLNLDFPAAPRRA